MSLFTMSPLTARFANYLVAGWNKGGFNPVGQQEMRRIKMSEQLPPPNPVPYTILSYKKAQQMADQNLERRIQELSEEMFKKSN